LSPTEGCSGRRGLKPSTDRFNGGKREKEEKNMPGLADQQWVKKGRREGTKFGGPLGTALTWNISGKTKTEK